ncbi:MAG: endolytic transglycosylase MltG [Clostridia bacterium]|nr:endolytic transglycosylase MltG [Clostridia bacterium]
MKSKRYYTYRSNHREREYGFFWYSGVWRVLRPVLIGLTSLILVVGLVWSALTSLYNRYAAPVSPEDDVPVAFDVTSGTSLTRVSANLEEAGLIHSGTVFKYYCDFAGLGQKIQTGHYELSKTMSMQEIAERLTLGDGIPLVRMITWIPGWSVEDFAAYLVERGVLDSPDRFLALCRTGTDFDEYAYIHDVLGGGSAGQRKYVLEGYLAPDTYEVYTSATEEDILRKLLSQTDRLYTEENLAAAAEAGLTMDQAIILASLIEKEAGSGDFAKVSAVFHNRLKAGMPLQSDVTIHYITGVRKMALTDSDTAVSSPYNTYRNKGLPPGPICSPSTAAVQAALHPDPAYVAENYLYFCAREPGSGQLAFSRTLAEHEQAVSLYRQRWIEYDESRGIR